MFNQTNLPAFSWTNVQILVAASTANTVLQFGFRCDPAYFGLDDISVAPINAPVLRPLAKANATMQFLLYTTVGTAYQVQYVTNLCQTNWINVGQPFTATNSSTTFTDAGASDPQRFYRMVTSP